MRRTLVALLNILIVLGLVVPIEIDEFAVSTGTREASAVAAGTSPAETEDSGEFTNRAKVKKKRRQDRRDKREKERKKDRDKANSRGNGKKKTNQGQNRREPQELPSGRLPAAQRLAAANGQPNIEDHYIVVLADSAGDAQRTATDLENDTGDVVPTYIYENIFEGFAAIIPDGSLDTVRSDPRVAEVIPDRIVHLSAQTLPTGIDRIDADTNPTAGIANDGGNVDIDVAVLDTAGDLSHPDLNIFRSTNCSSSSITGDSNGHGTHVGGTIVALDNDVGVVGVAPGARLWNVKVLNNSGSGTDSSVICGLEFVRDHASEIEVANLSLGGYDPSHGSCQNDAFHKAFCDVVSAGVTVAVAAGNDSDDARFYTPAAFAEVITVSALADSDGEPGGLGSSISGNRDDSLASFSNYGPAVDIAAPGVSILSTVPGGYQRFTGTSMAAPHVAGAAALYKATQPSATPGQVKAALRNAREDVALPNDSDGSNEGVLNVGGGFDPNPPPEPEPEPEPDPGPAPPGDDFSAPTVQWQAPVGNDQEFVTAGGTVALRAAASDDVGIDRVEFWLYSWATESWVLIGTDQTAPYQSTINAGTLDLGSNYLSADAYDTSQNWDYQLISIYNSGEVVAPAAKKDKKHKKKKKRGKRRRR